MKEITTIGGENTATKSERLRPHITGLNGIEIGAETIVLTGACGIENEITIDTDIGRESLPGSYSKKNEQDASISKQ